MADCDIRTLARGEREVHRAVSINHTVETVTTKGIVSCGLALGRKRESDAWTPCDAAVDRLGDVRAAKTKRRKTASEPATHDGVDNVWISMSRVFGAPRGWTTEELSMVKVHRQRRRWEPGPAVVVAVINALDVNHRELYV